MVTKAKEIGLYKPHGDKPLAQERESSLSNIILEEANAQQKDNIKNEDVLKKALELNPRDDVAYVELGRLYRDQGQFQQAGECLKKALELNPGNAEAYLQLGLVYHGKQRQFQQAEECFKKTLELNPGNAEAYIGLGNLYRDQGQFQQEEDTYKKALELNPENHWAYIGLGNLYRDQGQFQQAEECFNKALELNPGNDRAYVELGWLYRHQGQSKQAEDTYKKALELNPGKVVSAKLYGVLGSIYEEMGQFTLAEECYRNANQIRLSGYNPMTAYNYHKLKEILDKRKIKLVCVQYPMLNIEPLKKIFQGNIDGILFVDNEKTFKEAVKKGSYNMYFRDVFGGDFGHCTEKGNRLLAENIANVILKEVFHK
jgi:superkiller protein 3